MTAGSQYLQLYIFDNAWDPDTLCTQKIKPIVLKWDFSHTDLALQVPHFTHPTDFHCHSFSCSWKALNSILSKEQTLSCEERSQAFPCHSSVSTINLFCAGNKNYLRLHVLDQSLTRPRTISKFFGECQVCDVSLLSPKETWSNWSNKSKAKLMRSMPLLILPFPIARWKRKKQTSQGRCYRT